MGSFADVFLPVPTLNPETPMDEQQIALNIQALKNRLRGRGGRRGGRGGRAVSGRESADSECGIISFAFLSAIYIYLFYSSDALPKRKSKAKAQRKWGDEAPTSADMAELDFSTDKSGTIDNDVHHLQSLIDQSSLGARTNDGLYEVKDWDFTKEKDGTDDAIANALRPLDSKTASEGALGTMGSIFARLTGSKVLNEADLNPVLEAMKQHLMKKNVAMEIADKVCEGVGENLVGKKIGSFQSEARSIFSCFRVLTPFVISHQQHRATRTIHFLDANTHP
jgi:signal recognition particle receptor subunit alpha